MKAGLLTILLVLIGINADGYESLTDAFQASPGGVRGHLPESAVRYVIDHLGLGWETGWPAHASRGGTDVRAYCSRDRRYCVLSRASWGEWGQYGDAEYVLAHAESGMVWLRAGTVGGAPVVSNQGVVALFQTPGWPWSAHNRCHQVLLISARGDTLYRNDWQDHTYRPLQRQLLAEVHGFSPDGRFFILTINRHDPDTQQRTEYNNTWLYVIDLKTRQEHIEHLGSFWVRRLELSDKLATLYGEWRKTMTIGKSYDKGHYRIRWLPWKIERFVNKRVKSRL
jgi:hypothetical protein